MNRQRLTWPVDKKASAHPATPDEGPASPAYPGKDPDATKYENGDTSSWAEDPTKGPYPPSAHPAYPDEGPASPAYKWAKEKAALETKAAKCIRLATHVLGADATASAIENHAITLMDLPDRSILASLSRYGGEEEVEEKEEEEVEESKKKASDRVASIEMRLARLERILIRLAGEEEEEEVEEAKKKAGEEEEEEEVVEAKKKAGEEEEEEEEVEEAKKKAGMMSEEEQMLEKMLKEEGMFGDTAAAPAEAPAPEACGEMAAEGDLDIDMMLGDMSDPMGVMDTELDADEQMILAKLYNNAGEEKVEEKVEEEEAKKKAAAVRSAAQRPQPKKASAGPKTLGAVAKVASSSNEVDELSKLWSTAPDVSRHF